MVEPTLVGAFPRNIYLDKSAQLLNALCPIEVTPAPIVSGPFRSLQLENALFSIEVTLAGIVRAPVRFRQLRNALFPMEMRLLGAIKVSWNVSGPLRIEQPLNALFESTPAQKMSLRV